MRKKGERKKGPWKNKAKKSSLSPSFFLFSLSPFPSPYSFLTDPQAPPDVGPRHPPQPDLPLDDLRAEDRHEDLEDAERRRDERRGRDGDRGQEAPCFPQEAEREARGGEDAGQSQRRGRDGAGDRRPAGDLPQRAGPAGAAAAGEGEPPRFEVIPSPRVPRPERGSLSRGEAGEGEAEGREEGQGDDRDGGLKSLKGGGEEVKASEQESGWGGWGLDASSQL